MARISASLADVSTEFTPAPPGVYIFSISDVVEKTDATNRVSYQVKTKIEENISGDDEAVNKTVTDFISIHNKDGSVNQFSLIRLKRYFEAVLGKDNVEARGDDLDTDELKGGRFKGQIKIESYFPTGVDQTDESLKRFKNSFEAILPES